MGQLGCYVPYDELHFPLGGLDESQAFCRQQPREVVPQLYSRTCADALNVRGYEEGLLRLRGGTRPGLSKVTADRPGGALWVTQELNQIVSAGTPVQSSLSGRVVTRVAFSQGSLFYARAGDAGWTAATNTTGNNPVWNFNGIIRSAANNQLLFAVDGVNYAYFDPNTRNVYRWTAAAGTLPQDNAGNKPRLICTWRGRTCLASPLLDPEDWFFSKVGNPFDFNYGDTSNPVTVACAGTVGVQGLVGDPINTMIPWSDDVLIFGCDSSIRVMSGDPADGGQILRVSDGIGSVFGNPWCMAPDGTVFLFTNQASVVTLLPGQQPVPISQGIHRRLLNVDTGTNCVRLAWDFRFEGVWVFITPLGGPTPTTHYFYEARTGAWWPVQLPDNMNPLAVATFDGNTPADRAVALGSWDGYVRAVDPAATTDDGTAIGSHVVIGPLETQTFDEVLLYELLADLGLTSGTVNWSCFVGDTAEQALSSAAVESGTWNAGRNDAALVRRAGKGIYVRIDSNVAWQLERIRARVDSQGKVRSRSRVR